MTATPRILAFAGSARRDSYNKKLVRIAAAGARAAGVEVTTVDLRDYPMPIMDEDLEASEGMPAHAQAFKELLLDHQGLLIAAAEYNSSVTPLLKNTLDWASRKGPGRLQAWPFEGKVAAVLCASPGALGGMRALVHLRAILGNIGVLVLPEQVVIPKAHEAFLPDGGLKDPQRQSAVAALGARLAHVVGRLHA